jgi:hypothetical protein
VFAVTAKDLQNLELGIGHNEVDVGKDQIVKFSPSLYQKLSVKFRTKKMTAYPMKPIAAIIMSHVPLRRLESEVLVSRASVLAVAMSNLSLGRNLRVSLPTSLCFPATHESVLLTTP